MLPLLLLCGWIVFNPVGVLVLIESVRAADLSPAMIAGDVPELWIPLVALLLTSCLAVIYLGWVLFTTRLTLSKKIGWSVALVLFSPGVMPVMWWFYFQPESD